MIDWKKYFDRIYCIHYLPYKERYRKCVDELTRVGIRESGIFSWKLTWDSPLFDKLYQVCNAAPSVGCMKIGIAHYMCIKEAYELGFSHILILENDNVFLKDVDCIEKILDDKERLQWFASKYSNAQDAFFIGRGLDHAIGLEGSLKMKEISYVHSEAYAAGELKHGTISLIEQGTLVIGIMTQQGLYEKTLSNMEEVRSRGAYLFGLTSYGNYAVEDTVDFAVYVPKTEECFSASLAIIPLQLIGYYLAVAKGLDVDKPRNLAKSVTVE
jgi:hypothetical protein